MKTKKLNVKKIALIGMLGALGGILMMFKTPLPFMPPFMDFDLAALPEIIGGFALGPLAAVMIVAVKLIVKLAILGTSTAFVGELSNFIVSCAYVLPAIWIYDHHKEKKSALKGMVVGTVICTLTAVISNVYMIIPFYVNMMGWSLDTIISMCHAVCPLVNNIWTLALFGVVPFNLIKCGITSVITFIVYKKISTPLKQFARE